MLRNTFFIISIAGWVTAIAVKGEHWLYNYGMVVGLIFAILMMLCTKWKR